MIQLFHTHNYSYCVLCFECCQNAGGLHLTVHLNASCVDTEGVPKLLLLLC